MWDLGILIFIAICAVSNARTVHVEVQAPWPAFSSSPLVEVAEYLYDQSTGDEKFWSYVDKICMGDVRYTEDLIRNGHVIDVKKHALDLLYSTPEEFMLSEEELRVLRTSIDIGMYLPAVRMFESIAAPYKNPCSKNIFAVGFRASHGHLLCSEEEVDDFLDHEGDGYSSEDANSEKYDIAPKGYDDWDHVYRVTASDTHIVVYGTLGTANLCSMHNHLKKLDSIKYSLRHAFIDVPIPADYSLSKEGSGLAVDSNSDYTNELYGYGVYLDIKNMEYKTMDDGIQADANESDENVNKREDEDNFPEGEEVSGINFNKLLEVYQDSKVLPEQKKKGKVTHLVPLKDELKLFRKHLKDQAAGVGDSSGGMKVWNLKDLGLQAVQSVRQSFVKYRRNLLDGTNATDDSEFDYGSKLADIVQNFPAMASSLSTVKPSNKLRKEIESWYRGGNTLNHEQITPISRALPMNNVFINGIPINLDSPTFNVYDLISVVRNEYSFLGKLHEYVRDNLVFPENISLQAQLGNELIERVTSAAAIVSKGSGDNVGGNVMGGQRNMYDNPFDSSDVVRVDVSKGGKYAVHFMNNLEKDKMYKSWPKTLRTLVTPSWNLHTISRNLYTVVAIIQPLSIAGSSMLVQMNSLIEDGMPIRFGYVLSCEDINDSSGVWDVKSDTQTHANSAIGDASAAVATNLDVCVLYSKIKQDHSLKLAQSFLLSLASEITTVDSGEVGLFGDFFGGGNTDSDSVQPQTYKYDPEKSGNAVVTRDMVSDYYAAAINKGTGYKQEAVDTIINPTLNAYIALTEYAINTTAYIQARGLSVNLCTFNGVIVGEPGHVFDLSNALMQVIGREQYILSQAVARRVINDQTKSIFSAILEHSKAFLRYHPMLASEDSDGGQAVMQMNLFESSVPAHFVKDLLYWKNTIGGDSSLFSSVVHTNTIFIAATPNQAGYNSIISALEWLETRETTSHDLVGCVLLVPPAVEEHLSRITSAYADEDFGKSVYAQLNQLESDMLLVQYMQSQLLAVSAHDYLTARTLRSVFALVLRHVARQYEDGELPMVEAVVHNKHYTAVHAAMLDEVLNLSSTLMEANPEDKSLESLMLVFRTLLDDYFNTNKPFVDAGLNAFSVAAVKQLLSSGRYMRDLLLTGDEDLEFDFDSYVVYNSRIFEVGSTESLPKSLHSLDMELFVRMEDNRLSEQLRRSLEESDIAQADISMKTQFFFLYMSSFCGCYGSSSDSIGVNSGARFDVGNVLDQHDINSGRSSFVVDLYPSSEARNDANNSMVNVVFLFNPLSKAGQRAVGLLPLFQDLLQVKQTLIMVPDLEISEFPLQNFYRFVLPKGNGTWKSTANSFSGANFQQLPRQHTLTVRTDVPESWNVQTYQAMQDIDNLRCSSSGDNACGDPVFSVGDADGSEHSDALDEDEGDLGSGGGELLLLDAPGEVTSVSYLLKNLVVGGQCFENIAGADGRMRQKPPAGLQLVLQQPVTMYSNVSLRDMKQGSDLTCASDHCYKFVETIEQSDTLVMNNLGYYQLPANPGVWMLSLAPGRADSLFSIDGIEGDGMVSDASNGLPIVINSFGDTVKRLFVSKRKGLEHIGLLDDAAGVYDDLPEKSKAKTVQRTQSSGSSNTAAAAAASANMNSMWKSISSIWKQSEGNAKFFTSGAVDALKSGVNTETKEVETPVVVESKQVRVVDDDAERIHVFSLATGHMYERLLRIMMLSVSKRTSMPVKFWLFENYLSPSFKASAELMSITYGFEIGYVTYKWPAWLTPQSEKQRIIWGYKILFLDVLFPKSVKRIIYVDADQVVRADLKQLWNIDMEGKPYGYVPFCTSRNDTLGFQFWRSGFWKDHLRGKPYHISAIYMVDLENFRRHAVGDILRSIYNNLASDPNSLANLDQDLPNFAQHQVPIFSLPQEWLWCDTWCNEKSKKKAKTIDLCNNPLHKEPKLDMARRIINGPPLFKESWVELDDEIYQLLKGNN